ncbi:hypothetical protein Hanom_Chr14g01262121 [Helianthus anomalus]
MSSMVSAPYSLLCIVQTHHFRRCASSKPTMAAAAHPPNPRSDTVALIGMHDVVFVIIMLLVCSYFYLITTLNRFRLSKKCK